LGVVKVLQASRYKKGGKFKVNLTCHQFCLFKKRKSFFPYFSNLLDILIFHLLLFYHPSLVTEQKYINVH
jgi:hypothetical protein